MSQLLLPSRPARFAPRSHSAVHPATPAGRNTEVAGMLREMAFIYRLTEQVKAEIRTAGR